MLEEARPRAAWTQLASRSLQRVPWGSTISLLFIFRLASMMSKCTIIAMAIWLSHFLVLQISWMLLSSLSDKSEKIFTDFKKSISNVSSFR